MITQPILKYEGLTQVRSKWDVLYRAVDFIPLRKSTMIQMHLGTGSILKVLIKLSRIEYNDHDSAQDLILTKDYKSFKYDAKGNMVGYSQKSVNKEEGQAHSFKWQMGYNQAGVEIYEDSHGNYWQSDWGVDNLFDYHLYNAWGMVGDARREFHQMNFFMTPLQVTRAFRGFR